ncbi:receptor-like protein 4 isoform X2 [Malania oleifera]|uniref:receptor-like protein 4 isoform X2 n=1 Tax=Malania oleifera TaxID=397392 RepID=UPI0025ADE38F|nr:receptor-like protein 4 isoform X2 [Malania oleifera]
MFGCLLLPLLAFFSALPLSVPRPAPFAMRISCGARENVHTSPTNTLWFKDFAYTGGIPTNGTRPSYITPPLKTVRYFPRSAGPENCYNINRVPSGHYSVRIFFGLVAESNFVSEPLFDVSMEGTLVYSLKSGWSHSDDEQVFVEALVFLTDGSASLCFHSTGHGDPAIFSIEILQVDDKAYYFGQNYGKGTILRTVQRLSTGSKMPKFDEDYRGDHWGGDRLWNPIMVFNPTSDSNISTGKSIRQASVSPNFYPEALYKTALISTDVQPDLAYTLPVDPNRNYSIWLHFAEIDRLVNGVGQRVFDILINGDIVFKDVDIVRMSGDLYTAFVLNKTVAINGRSLTISLHPTKGNSALICAIEVFEVIIAEFNTSPDEVKALQALKSALELPLRFGWNGDPCVPQQHPWSGVDCQFDGSSGKWFIDGLDLDNQGLRGFLPNEIFWLHRLQSINLSGNGIHGVIPSTLGNITSLETLDFSYNSFNGSIPESLGQLTSLRRLDLNSNSLSGRVPSALGARLLHRASFNFTDNAGLCGIPGLPACGRLSAGAKVGIGLAASMGLLLIIICSVCWWKRRQNILRAQRIAARDAPYAKARTHFARDVQMAMQHGHEHARTAAESGPSLLS